MDNLPNLHPLNENRKPYLKPQVEIVPLLPKQTVLATGCYSSSQMSGEDNVGCGFSLCELE